MRLLRATRAEHGRFLPGGKPPRPYRAAVTFIDGFRLVIFGEFGAMVAFMVGTNILAWKVLRPPRRLGFLWWHITCMSVGVVLISIIALERVAGHLGSPPTWRTWVTFSGMTLLTSAQVIVYQVERARYVARLATDIHGKQTLAEALAELDEG